MAERRATKRTRKTTTRKTPTKKWSRRVMETSDALDLEPGVFKRGPRAIALSLKRSAERSTRRKASPYASAMSMLTFYVNRGGANLGERDRARLERAKDELRDVFGRPPRTARETTARKTAARKTTARKTATRKSSPRARDR